MVEQLLTFCLTICSPFAGILLEQNLSKPFGFGFGFGFGCLLQGRCSFRGIMGIRMHMKFADIHSAIGDRWPDVLKQLGFELRLKVHGPCPACGGKDRFTFDNDRNRGNWICNHCGSGDGFDLLMRVHDWTFVEARKRVMEITGLSNPGIDPKPITRPIETFSKAPATLASNQRVRALESSWCDLALCPDAVAYLESRFLWSMPPDHPLHGHLGVKYFDNGKIVGYFPAILAPVTDIDGNRVTVHCTYLANGKKLQGHEPRKLLGKVKDHIGCAVRLMQITDGVLGLTEGIETALSAAKLHGIPMWAALNAGLLAKFEPPPYVLKLVIFADRDQAGIDAANKLAERLKDRFEIELKLPPEPFKDWNDVLMDTNKSLEKIHPPGRQSEANTQAMADAEKLAAWLAIHGGSTAREVRIHGPFALRKKDQLEAAMNVLIGSGRLRIERCGQRSQLMMAGVAASDPLASLSIARPATPEVSQLPLAGVAAPGVAGVATPNPLASLSMVEVSPRVSPPTAIDPAHVQSNACDMAFEAALNDTPTPVIFTGEIVPQSWLKAPLPMANSTTPEVMTAPHDDNATEALTGAQNDDIWAPLNPTETSLNDEGEWHLDAANQWTFCPAPPTPAPAPAKARGAFPTPVLVHHAFPPNPYTWPELERLVRLTCRNWDYDAESTERAVENARRNPDYWSRHVDTEPTKPAPPPKPAPVTATAPLSVMAAWRDGGSSTPTGELFHPPQIEILKGRWPWGYPLLSDLPHQADAHERRYNPPFISG